jgi:hypothetical protein
VLSRNVTDALRTGVPDAVIVPWTEYCWAKAPVEKAIVTKRASGMNRLIFLKSIIFFLSWYIL